MQPRRSAPAATAQKSEAIGAHDALSRAAAEFAVASIRAMGKGVLMAESNVHHIPDYVDRLYVLERGELMFSGSLAEARRDRDVMRVIAGEVEVTH